MFSLPFIFYYLFDYYTAHPQPSTLMGSLAKIGLPF